jgi:CRP-like cAMP-binding protein
MTTPDCEDSQDRGVLVFPGDRCDEIYSREPNTAATKVTGLARVSHRGSVVIPIERLAGLRPFASADRAAVVALAGIGSLVRFGSQETLFRAGSEPRGWWVVLEGRVRVVRGVGVRRHVVHTEGPGGTLGEVPLFANGSHPATATASEPTVCALFHRHALVNVAATNATVAFLLLERLAQRVRGLVERLDDRSVRSVNARLAEFLLQRSPPTPASLSIGMTQQELAEELGTVREVISRELRSLRAAGIIEARGGGRYRILDLRRLRAAAE